MSSRTGNVKTLSSLEADLEDKIRTTYGKGKEIPETVFGALKYEFLKHRIGGDFIFDVGEAISLEGNSGPYLQYSHARARSILTKAGDNNPKEAASLEAGERKLLRKISEYAEVLEVAVRELLPSHITTYLYELSQAFNSFYEDNRVIDDPRETTRVMIVGLYADVLKDGLEILGIPAPERV
jgi:arginyl-tRNA synthetase